MLTGWVDTDDGLTAFPVSWTKESTNLVSLDGVRALFTFRLGGASESPYGSLNLGLHVEDDPIRVMENRARVARHFSTGIDSWVLAEQVHGSNVAVVDASQKGAGSSPDRPPVQGVDGLVTATPGLTLGVLVADCVPVIFYDAVRRVAAVAHSGWRGTVGHISARVVECMEQTFHSTPGDIQVWLGPSIRSCCYEVDQNVASIVRSNFDPRCCLPRHGTSGKYLLSLQSCIREDLIRVGVSPNHIQDTGLCTACRTDFLYSHRRESGRTGRLMGLIALS